MKYKELYPQVRRVTIGPAQDIFPDREKQPDLSCGGGYYFCHNCKTLTNWHYFIDNMVWMVCSTECLETLLKPVDSQPDQVV